MPWRYQWAKYFIDHYRNFGQRVNSPFESAHKQLKSFLVSGRGHLFHLHESIEQMLEEKERTYKESTGNMQMKKRVKYNN
ncbi:hypothetical protein E4U59_005894 [Claviceps monticola]|nr:hypothetical protein E4U59_005894 [Claviceps monticola]